MVHACSRSVTYDVGKLNNGPQAVHVLIPRICGYYFSKTYSGVIKLRIWRWGDFPCIIWWSINASTNILIRRRKREIPQTRRGEGNVITEVKGWSDTAASQEFSSLTSITRGKE